jgi:hypothetical protein
MPGHLTLNLVSYKPVNCACRQLSASLVTNFTVRVCPSEVWISYPFLIAQQLSWAFSGWTFPNHIHLDTSQSVELLWTGVGPSQRPVPGNTHNTHKRQTSISAGIQTRNPSQRAAIDPRIIPLGHWDQLSLSYMWYKFPLLHRCFHTLDCAHSLRVLCRLLTYETSEVAQSV